MECPKCGETTSGGHTFCLNCGAELPREALEPTTSSEPSATAGRSTATATQASAPARQTGARRRRSSGESVVPPLVALLLSVALQQAVNSIVPPEAYLHRLFRPAGGWIMSVVPALIAFAFIWTVTDLFLKYRIASRNEGDLGRAEVRQLPQMVRHEPIGAALQRMRAWDIGLLARPVGRRLLWLMQHLDTVDPQRAHELTRHQSDLEADTAASGYRTVRLFIWAMPILGFIGTVLGISLAVGGFSEFLTTNVSIDEIDRVTAELGNVASGLSFAFDTTLLGLLGGLVASVASSGVQAKEERFLTGLEQFGLRIMETVTAAGTTSAPTTAPAPAGAEFDQMMRERLKQLSTQMQQFTRAVQSGLDGFLTEWGQLPPEVEKVGSDLKALREHLSSAAKSSEKMILETRLLLEGLNEASSHMGNRLTASIGSISQTVEGLGSSLGGVSETLETGLAGLTERVQSSESHLRSGLASLQEAIEKNARDDEATEGALERLSAAISELGGTLNEFRETQSAMVPLLSQLSGPLELRLMPTPVSSPRQD